MTDLIWVYTKLGKSNKYVELQVFKEYLYAEIENLRKELKDETKKAEKGNVSSYVINIFTKTFENRIEHLNSITKNIVSQINQMEKEKQKQTQ